MYNRKAAFNPTYDKTLNLAYLLLNKFKNFISLLQS